MEKRLPLFLFLSFLILFGWTVLFPRPKPSGDVAATPSGVPPAAAVPGAVPPETTLTDLGTPAMAADEERELELLVGGAGTPSVEGRRGAYRAVFTNRGARLLHLELADYFRTLGLDEEAQRDPANWLPLLESVELEEGTSTNPSGLGAPADTFSIASATRTCHAPGSNTTRFSKTTAPPGGE